MNKQQKQHYLSKMRLNIKLAYIKNCFLSLLFFMPIWYSYETQFADLSTLMTVYAVTHMVTIVLELPTGAMADLLGRKKTVLLGLLIAAISWLFISQAKSVTWLWYGYMINAVANALVSGSDSALHYDSLKELGKERSFAKFSSKAGLIFRVGMIISTLIGGQIFPYNLAYVLVGISTLIGAFLTTATIMLF